MNCSCTSGGLQLQFKVNICAPISGTPASAPHAVSCTAWLGWQSRTIGVMIKNPKKEVLQISSLRHQLVLLFQVTQFWKIISKSQGRKTLVQRMWGDKSDKKRLKLYWGGICVGLFGGALFWILISYLDGEDLGETFLAMAGGLMELHTLNRCESAAPGFGVQCAESKLRNKPQREISHFVEFVL